MITDNTRKYARVIEASQRVRWEIVAGKPVLQPAQLLVIDETRITIEEMKKQ